jgi:hypothetical protein
MSLNHDFLLRDRSVHSDTDYSRQHHPGDAILLHDDFLRYISDSLGWIPAENPAKRGEPGMGLNFYGPTSITQRGAQQAFGVFSAWAALLALGPPTLRLRGLWSFIEGEPQSGAYDVLELDRDELVAKLRCLAEWTQAVTVNPDLYVLHLGI